MPFVLSAIVMYNNAIRERDAKIIDEVIGCLKSEIMAYKMEYTLTKEQFGRINDDSIYQLQLHGYNVVKHVHSCTCDDACTCEKFMTCTISIPERLRGH